MYESNRRDIVAHPGFRTEYADKVFLLRVYDEEPADMNAANAYYGNLDEFENVYQMLRRTNLRFLQYLIEKHHLEMHLPAG